MSFRKRKLILDSDPGGDDAIAFLWMLSLAKQGFLDVVAVTSADGNVQARLTFMAAAKLLKLCGFDTIPVGRGVIGRAAGHVEDAAAIHGADGMGNLSPTLPDVAIAYETACSSDDMLIEQLKAMPGEITLLAIGPLTNLAAAERKVPGILNLAAEIVIMGGAFNTPGNITPAAEFNIAYDPEAAALVFSRCHNLVVLPLDITRRLIFTNQMAQQIAQAKPDSAIAQFVVNLCQFMTTTALAFRETSGVAGFLVHDAVTLAYLFYPELLHFRRGQVWIETQGDWSRGKTLIDDRHQPKASANAWVAIDVDAGNLLAALIADLKYLILA